MQWDLAWRTFQTLQCASWLLKWKRKKPRKEALGNTAKNISPQGQKHSGPVLGSRTHFEEYVNEKVEKWVEQVVRLAVLASSNSQASYAAFTIGPKHRWTCYLRTLPDNEEV